MLGEGSHPLLGQPGPSFLYISIAPTELEV
jgi:hypothetical protein